MSKFWAQMWHKSVVRKRWLNLHYEICTNSIFYLFHQLYTWAFSTWKLYYQGLWFFHLVLCFMTFGLIFFLSKYDICTAVDNLIQFALEWISFFSFQMMETVNFSLKSEKWSIMIFTLMKAWNLYYSVLLCLS